MVKGRPGRPRSNGEKKRKTYIYLSPDQDAALRQLALAEQRSKAKMATMLFEMGLQAKKQLKS